MTNLRPACQASCVRQLHGAGQARAAGHHISLGRRPMTRIGRAVEGRAGGLDADRSGCEYRRHPRRHRRRRDNASHFDMMPAVLSITSCGRLCTFIKRGRADPDQAAGSVAATAAVVGRALPRVLLRGEGRQNRIPRLPAGSARRRVSHSRELLSAFGSRPDRRVAPALGCRPEARWSDARR